MRRETAVRPAEVSSMAMRNLVRSRKRPIADLLPRLALPDKFVACAVDCPEVHRVGGIFLQLLPQAKHVGIDGAGSGIVVVAPHLIEQFGTRDHALLVVQEEAQHLELLRSERHQLSVAMQLHLGKVYLYVIEAE